MMSRHGHTEISLALPQISARCEKEEVLGEKRLKIDACDLCFFFLDFFRRTEN
jgi:hypothetical protein